MQYIKAKFENSKRSYTYRTKDDGKPGDIVTNDKGSKLTVVDEPVDSAWIKAYGADKVAVVKKYVEPVGMIVKNWSLFANTNGGFRAPELCSMHLQGYVYGNPKFNDGDPINTSRIVQIEDKEDHKDIITISGSRYSVYPADVDPKCEEQFHNYYERLKMEGVS